jgi:hypothetical protein
VDKTLKETKKYLINFLQEFKGLVYEGKIWIKDRKNTLDTLNELGYTLKNLEEILLSLTILDYYAGPKADIYVQGDHYWEFGRIIDGQEYYIKIKIGRGLRDETAICLSFHKPEWPLRFPFREEPK